jgi:hypothetical protein
MATLAGAFEDKTLPLEPIVVMTPMQMVTIKASMIAYSTAVGPSSFFKKLTDIWINFRTTPLPLNGRAARLEKDRSAP